MTWNLMPTYVTFWELVAVRSLMWLEQEADPNIRQQKHAIRQQECLQILNNAHTTVTAHALLALHAASWCCMRAACKTATCHVASQRAHQTLPAWGLKHASLNAASILLWQLQHLQHHVTQDIQHLQRIAYFGTGCHVAQLVDAPALG
jgi:hypothetical protein